MSSDTKHRPPRPLQDELSEAMHGEFTVNAETDRQRRNSSAHVRLGLVTGPETVNYYGFPFEQIVTLI